MLFGIARSTSIPNNIHYSDCDAGAFRIMAVPAEVAAHFIVVKTEGFGRFQVLFDAPARADGSHHGGQRGLGWRPDQVVGHLVWAVQAAAHHEPMATVCDPSMHDGQTSPVKE